MGFDYYYLRGRVSKSGEMAPFLVSGCMSVVQRTECVRKLQGPYCQERLRVLCSGFPSGVIAVGNKNLSKYTTKASFLSAPSSSSSFFFFFLSLSLSSFPLPISTLYLLLLSPIQASFCLDWLSLNVLLESFHHDLHKARAHGCAGKSLLSPCYLRFHMDAGCISSVERWDANLDLL